MAITAALVYAKANSLRFLITSTVGGGEALTLTNAVMVAAAAPGVLKQIINAPAAGYGKIAAGSVTAPQAKALLASENAASLVGVIPPTAIARYTARTTTGAAMSVAAGINNEDGLNRPAYTITSGAAGLGYLDITVPGQIGA